MGYYKFTGKEQLEERIGEELGLARIAQNNGSFQIFNSNSDNSQGLQIHKKVKAVAKLRVFKLIIDDLARFYLNSEDLEMAKTIVKKHYLNYFELNMTNSEYEDFAYTIKFYEK